MIDRIINKAFIDELRLNTSIATWIFKDEKESDYIKIPKNLTHSYLLENYEIDTSIYNYYHLPTIGMISDSEYNEMVKSGYVAKKETILKPYSNIIFGAYYLRSDLKFKLFGFLGNVKYFLNGKEIESFNDLTPYFKDYAKGFEDGFNEFENIYIKPYLTLFPDKADYINKVFDFITKNIPFKHSWHRYLTGFNRNQNKEIINGFEDGQKQGFFYRAWSIVFSNSELFTPLFNALIEKPTPEPIKTKADKLKEQLHQYGFFELEKVKALSEQSKVAIIEKITDSGLPYAIAMFDYLQFISYLEKKHFESKYKLNKEISKWFDSDKEGRAVKGNISSLSKYTTENKARYTAHKHKENVINEYELLK